jgi:GntR family transcriptional regulator of gluconate operon
MKETNSQLSRSFFSSRVVNELRKNIILGKIKAGDKIVETAISAEMQVSRGPVRNALFILESEGLVTFLPNGRTVSNGFSLTDAEKLYQMRSFIEFKAIELIFKQPQLDFHQIQHINDQLRQAKHDAVAFTNLDINYHYELVKSSGNNYLLQCWVSLRPLFETILLITNNRVRKEGIGGFDKGYVIDHHEKITAALIAGNFNDALLLLKEHLDTGQRAMIEKLREFL